MYQSSLNDKEWGLIEHHFCPTDKRGSSYKHEKKIIVDAILYVVEGGIKWRMMPNDFPPWKTVYDHFSRWNKSGVWETALDEMNRMFREKQKRSADPSYGIVDAQSVKTQFASEEIGYDGGKKVKGHKRHIVVDILGNLLHVSVHAANLSDTKQACNVLDRTLDKYPTIEAFSGDGGYRGTAVKFVEEHLNIKLYISKRIGDGFVVLRNRWIVERTFAWIGNFRRLAKDVETLIATSENMIRIAMLKLTLGKCT